MPRLDIQMAADVAQIQRDMNKAVGIVDKSVRDINRIGGTIKNVFGGLIGGFSAYRLVTFIKDQIDAADAMQEFSQRTGMTVETLAGLDSVAKKTGTTLEAFATANKKLSVYMTEASLGGREQQKMLTALGITSRDPIERMYQMADAMVALEDPTLRSAVATKFMGKTADELLPALLKGSEGMKEMVEQGKLLSGVTAENARLADEFNDSLADLGVTAKTVGLALGTAFIQASNAVGEFLRYGGGAFGDQVKQLEIARQMVEALRKRDDVPEFTKKIYEAELLRMEARVKAAAAARKVSDELIPPLAFDLDKFLEPVERAFKTEGMFPSGSSLEKSGPNAVTQIICTQMGGVWDGANCNLEAGKFVERINKQIAGIYGNVYAVMRQEAAQHGFGDLVEKDIQRLESAKARADAARYENEQNELTIRSHEANVEVVGKLIKGNTDLAEAIRFQTSLYGLSRLEQEQLTEAHRIELEMLEKLNAISLSDDTQSGKNNRMREAREEAERAKKEIAEALDAQNEARRDFQTGFDEGLQDIVADATNTAEQVRGFFVNMFQGMEDAIVRFVQTGKLSFRDFANAVIEDLLRIAIQQQIVAPLAQGLFGAFGGGRAGGGPVSTGQAYLVGERGPELFVPDTAGSIVPNGGGMAPKVSINVINQGLPMDAKVGQPKFNGENFVIDVVLRNIHNNGPLRAALGGGG